MKIKGTFVNIKKSYNSTLFLNLLTQRNWHTCIYNNLQMPNERTTYINVTWFLLPFITYIKVPQFGSCNITQFTCSININYKYSHLHAIYTCVQMKRSGVGKRHKSKASLLSVILLQILFEDIKNHKGLIVSFFYKFFLVVDFGEIHIFVDLPIFGIPVPTFYA